LSQKSGEDERSLFGFPRYFPSPVNIPGKKEVREAACPGQGENCRVFHIWVFRPVASALPVGNVDKVGSSAPLPNLSPEGLRVQFTATYSKD